jgi:hypothetical protein
MGWSSRVMVCIFSFAFLMGCGGGDGDVEKPPEDTAGTPVVDTAGTPAADTGDTPGLDTVASVDSTNPVPEPDTATPTVPVPESFPALHTCDARKYWCEESYCGSDKWYSEWNASIALYHQQKLLPEWQPEKGNFCGEIPGRFQVVDSGDDYLYDHMLKGHWSLNHDFGKEGGLRFKRAECHCADLGNGFRLPTALELISIIVSNPVTSEGSPGFPDPVSSWAWSVYWTSTPTKNVVSSDVHWAVDLINGQPGVPSFVLWYQGNGPGTGWSGNNKSNWYDVRMARCFRPDNPVPGAEKCYCKPMNECYDCVDEKYPGVNTALGVAMFDHCICGPECSEVCAATCSNPSTEMNPECNTCFTEEADPSVPSPCTSAMNSTCQNTPGCQGWLGETQDCN